METEPKPLQLSLKPENKRGRLGRETVGDGGGGLLSLPEPTLVEYWAHMTEEGACRFGKLFKFRA